MSAVAVLGSTGSIGTRALDVIESAPERHRVVALAAGRDVDRLERQVRRHRPRVVAVAEAEAARDLRARLGEDGASIEIVDGPAGLARAASLDEVDTVVHGVVGAAGLHATVAAVDAGKTVALANKESLVAAGAWITTRAARSGARLIPVDSEHGALHQCLRGERVAEVRRLWLTASGGPFRTTPAERLGEVTPQDALRHPTWSMGERITVDSATLMNKGLEIIEARWLFDVPEDRIAVVVHPESVVHSMVEFVDGSWKAQLGPPDMRSPIRYALDWPARHVAPEDPAFDPRRLGALRFEAPDESKFPCLGLAREALRRGGAAPAALNAADEVAVRAFLDRRLAFPGIAEVVRRVLDEIGEREANCIDDILAADRDARRLAARAVERGAVP